MLSLRVTRDKRGYEHIYLIADGRRRDRVESRLVYWCRMPGGMRVGREPFDAETREAIERGNPDLAFDWPVLTKSLNQSLASARWAARQERVGGGGAAAAKPGRRPGGKPDCRGDGRAGGKPGHGGRDRGRHDRGRGERDGGET